MKSKILKTPNKAIKELEKLSKKLKGNNSVKVGLPQGSNAYPDGTSVIMVGAVHEFGSDARNIPERSFLRSTLKAGKNKYKKLFKKLAKQIVDGKIDKKKALSLLGLQLQGDVQQKIVDIKVPPNTQDTVDNKKSSNPLIDTGHLRQSIVFEVDE